MKKCMYLLVLFGIFLNFSGCGILAKNDAINWKIDPQKNHGIDVIAVESIYNTIINDERILSFLVIKDGHLISEYYAEGYNKDSVFPFYSCAKSVTSAVYGIALDMGIIKGPETKVVDYFPKYTGNGKENTTIEHLLNLTCGLEWPELSPTTHDHITRDWVPSKNWTDFILERDVESAPGINFNYNSGAVHLLSGIFQKSTGKKLSDFAEKQLFKKIGMKSVKWEEDPQGITLGGGGIHMTSRDAARFGQLYANKGKWRGKQIVPEEWVQISTGKHSDGVLDYGTYGYLWWINEFVNDFGTDEVYKMFYAMGMNGQFIFVVPEYNLVSVITSEYISYLTLRNFKQYVENGIKR